MELSFVRLTESKTSPIEIEIALFEEIVEFSNWMKPLVSMTKIPPFTAKLFEIEQLLQRILDESFKQNRPPSEAAFSEKEELKISVLVPV